MVASPSIAMLHTHVSTPSTVDRVRHLDNVINSAAAILFFLSHSNMIDTSDGLLWLEGRPTGHMTSVIVFFLSGLPAGPSLQARGVPK